MITDTRIHTHLFSGEIFTTKDESYNSDSFLQDDNLINDKYKKGEIRIVTEQARYPLDNITTMIDSEKYDLNPEYQRRKRWDSKRKSRLIESFIMNVPVPPIFLYEVDYSIYEVMDGLQRLTTIYDFYKGKFVLEDLEYWRELNGRNYDNLPEQVRKGIDRRYLSSIVLLQETAKSKEEADHLKQIVFERLNSGGEKLTPQETRNALHNGKFNQLCIKLATENECFRKMWKLPLESEGEEKLLVSERYRKMEDVELVLRFFAYRHVDKLASPIDRFLDEYLKQANSFADETLKELEKLFNDTVELIYGIFQDSAFLVPTNEREYKKPSKIIYDPIMQAFALNISHRSNLLKNGKTIKENKYRDKKALFPSSGKSLFDGRNNNRGDVKSRIEYFDEFLKDYIS
jgi:hypothetical protein